MPGRSPITLTTLPTTRFSICATLNEPVAGQSGFVKLTPDGNHFALGNGTPARFWCVNTTVYRQSQPDLERHARFLAKIGVNMVRMHGSFSPKGKGKKITDVDDEEIDRCWRLGRGHEKAGHLLHHFSVLGGKGGHAGTAASWNIPGAGDGGDLWGLLFFNDELRNGYKAWTRALYTRKNPVYRDSTRARPRRRHHPDTKRGQPVLLDDAGAETGT